MGPDAPPTPPGMRPMTPELLELAREERARGVPYAHFARQYEVTLMALYSALGRP